MRNRICTACDGCQNVLEGIKGTQVVKSNYLTIRGTICYEAFDKNKVKHFTYGSSSTEEAVTTYLHFCNGKCIDDYMSARVFLKSQWHENNNLPEVDYGTKQYTN